MNILKKLLSISAAAICSISIFSNKYDMNVNGEELIYGNLKYYSIDIDSDGTDDYIEISGCTDSATEIEIPETIDGLLVIIIRQKAFFNCSELESVKLPDSMSNIGRNAFKGTAFYENQTGIKYAGDWVIGCDASLKEAVIKDGTKHIADYSFYENENLKSVSIPESMTTIGNQAFLSCTGLTSIVVPKKVSFLGSNAFAGCEKLSWIRFENPDLEINGEAAAISNGIDANSSKAYFNGIIYGYSGSKAQEYAEKYNRTFSAIDSENIKGDANCDGELNIRDAAFIARKLAQRKQEELPSHADFNNDGTVNIRDAAAIARYMVSKYIN